MSDAYSIADLTSLASDCLKQAGVPSVVAEDVARDVAFSELEGAEGSGFEGLLRDIRLIRYGRLDPNAAPILKAPAPAVIRVDACHGFAAAAMSFGMNDLCQRTSDFGMAMLQIERASPPGILSAALADIGQKGLIGLAIRAGQTAYAIAPMASQSAPVKDAHENMLDGLLALAPPPQDLPISAPVNGKAWMVALDPKVTETDDLLATLPAPGAQPIDQKVKLAPELLAQIINA